MGLCSEGGHDRSPAPSHICFVPGRPARAFQHPLSNDPHTLCQKGIIFLTFTDRETEAHKDLVTRAERRLDVESQFPSKARAL